MAKSYYKYKERDSDPVDYAGMSEDLSKGVMDVVTGINEKTDKLTADVRKAKGAAEDGGGASTSKKTGTSSTSDGGEGDYDIPMTQERDVNGVLIDISSQGSNKGLEFKNLYDSGQISGYEYKKKREALRNTFSTLKEASVAIQLMAKATSDGVKGNTIDAIQQLEFKQLMSYNFTDPRVKIEVDDDGVGWMYRVDEKGVTIPQTKKTIDQIKNMAIQQYPSYDLQGNVDQIVGNLGKTLEKVGRGGKSTEDLLKYEPIGNSVNGGVMTPIDLINDYATGLTDNDLASILTAQLGSKYEAVNDPYMSVTVDANGDEVNDQYKILYQKDDASSGVGSKIAKLTPEQRVAAEEFVKREVLSRFNVTEAAPKGLSDTERKAREEKGKNIDAVKADVNNLKKIFEGKSEAEVGQALSTYSEQLAQLVPDEKTDEFIRAEVTGVGDNRSIQIIYKDANGKLKSKPVVTKIPSNLQDFIDAAGPNITGNSNLLTLRKEAMGDIKDPSSLVRGDAGGSYEIKTLSGGSQEILDWDTVFPTLTEVGWYMKDSTRDANSIKRVESFSDNSEITGFDYSVDKGVLKMSLKGLGDLSIDLKGKNANQIQAEIDLNLNRIHKAATTGTPLSGAQEPSTNPADKKFG
jgi:hypothetical protein